MHKSFMIVWIFSQMSKETIILYFFIACKNSHWIAIHSLALDFDSVFDIFILFRCFHEDCAFQWLSVIKGSTDPWGPTPFLCPISQQSAWPVYSFVDFVCHQVPVTFSEVLCPLIFPQVTQTISCPPEFDCHKKRDHIAFQCFCYMSIQ